MDISAEFADRISNIKASVTNPRSFDVSNLANLANLITNAFRNGGKIAFVGNGGSAAESIHLAAEFTGKCVNDHAPLYAISLNDSQSSLTAIANDYGVEHMFSRVAQAYLDKNDVLIALSTSGKSKNILNAIKVAKLKGAKVFLWMGDFDLALQDVEIWKAPSKSTPRIQEIHLMWGHMLAEVVELNFQ